jgi:FkbM family methyltransferase
MNRFLRLISTAAQAPLSKDLQVHRGLKAMFFQIAKKTVLNAANRMGYVILSQDEANTLRTIAQSPTLWSALSLGQRQAVRSYISYSRSQLGQDIFALSELYDKPHLHYFVEFGSCDGVKLSNTWCLENKLGWKGILAEPARVWHEGLLLNRTCAIDFRCISPTGGGKIKFQEWEAPEFSSTVSHINCGDMNSLYRLSKASSYEVETVTLNDLLEYHRAPKGIGYLSVDTEGGEHDILKGFDFGKWDIHVITVEHNYRERERAELYELLSSKGYTRKHKELSQFDDWYVRV